MNYYNLKNFLRLQFYSKQLISFIVCKKKRNVCQKKMNLLRMQKNDALKIHITIMVFLIKKYLNFFLDKMDINEELKILKTNVNGKFVSNGEVSLDVLECLKTIQELKRELVKEQHLRMVYERELKNKLSTSTFCGIEGASSSLLSNSITFSTNGFFFIIIVIIFK